MSELFEISASSGSYKVKVQKGCITNGWPFSFDNDTCLLIDSRVKNLWGNLFNSLNIPIYILDAAEDNKTLIKAGEIIEWMRCAGMTRNARLFAVGGGIVQDLATIVSSIYMRGIRWSYIPTSLLSMVDSCIGGKSSINVGNYKNIAGNFYPPESIYIDIALCNTLQEFEIIAGLCEAVKITYADCNGDFERFLECQDTDSKKISENYLSQIVSLALGAKKKFIEADEFDIGERQLLNFGHGIGHAIEASSGYTITHGIAVGVGMIVELEISRRLGISNWVSPRAINLVMFLKEILGRVSNLGENLKKVSADIALDKFKSDKKHTNNEYSLIAINNSGFLHKVTIKKSDVVDQILRNSFLELHKIYENALEIKTN
jgi:3-dehydroquinate synthase